MTHEVSIARHLMARLREANVEHIFGVPGDYVLGFYAELTKGPLRHVGTTREDTAAFAADGYARCRGLGALAVTYGVGALNVVNAVAGAKAESSPVVLVSGAPGVRERRTDPMIHHRFGPFGNQREVFERVTCATTVLEDPWTAFRQIDRALAAARRYSQPVYIELPRDRVTTPGYPVPFEPFEEPQSDPEALQEALEETLQRLRQARSPVILAGVEAHRRGLQDRLARLVQKSGLPIAATLTGKSVVGERHPAYLGVYEGAMGGEEARAWVEEADLLLMLGVALNDVDLGIYTARLDPNRMVRASQGEVVIRHHRFVDVHLGEFLAALEEAVPRREPRWPGLAPPRELPDFPQPRRPMTVARLVARLNTLLSPEMMVVADTGDCLFAALELRVHARSEFLASAFYTTMGFGVPAALGAQLARPEWRPLVLVGDGAFAMTGTELASAARLGLDPIVIVFNNGGYSTERFILEGPFNDIPEWRFDRLGEVFGPLHGHDVHTEEDFERAWRAALNDHDGPTVMNVHLRPEDASPAMRRLAVHLRDKVSGEK